MGTMVEAMLWGFIGLIGVVGVILGIAAAIAMVRAPYRSR